jgi:hypothetical protein
MLISASELASVTGVKPPHRIHIAVWAVRAGPGHFDLGESLRRWRTHQRRAAARYAVGHYVAQVAEDVLAVPSRLQAELGLSDRAVKLLEDALNDALPEPKD